MTEEDTLDLISRWQAQDQQATELLMAIAYQKLHAISHQHRDKLPADADTQLLNQSATDIAHEVYLKFRHAAPQMSIITVREFYQYLNATVRNLYVDQYRRFNQSNKADLLTRLFSPNAIVQADQHSEQEMEYADLAELLTQLSEGFPRQGEVLELRFFAQRSNKEIARLLDISLRTVENDIRFAKAWLKSKMHH